MQTVSYHARCKQHRVYNIKYVILNIMC